MILGYIDPGTGGYTLASGINGLLTLLAAGAGLCLAFLKRFWLIFKKRPWLLWLLIGFAASVILYIIHGMIQDRQGSYPHKIIVLGLDGLDPAMTERMMAAGQLPHFLKLKETGSYRHLATSNPPQSPVAWSGFATGKNPGQNGVFDFLKRDPQDYKISLSLAYAEQGNPKSVLGAKGFWWYASRKKVPSVVIGCPLTFPAQKLFGRMLSGMGVPDIRGTEGTFTYYTSDKNIQPVLMGHFIHMDYGTRMSSYFWGPKYFSLGGKTLKARVPFEINPNQGQDRLTLSYQNKKVILIKGQWSPWLDISFTTGLFQVTRGIMKLYLAEIQPDFKLYMGPINFDPRRPLYPISYPASYSRRIAQHNGLFYTQGMPFESWGVNEGALSEGPFLDQVNQAFQERRALLDWELQRVHKGILFCYFGMPDIIQHMFWRFIDPGHPLYTDKDQAYARTIDAWYRKMDDVVGEAMQKLGPQDTLIVLSDHGFNTYRRSVHINAWLMDHGYLALKDPSATSGGSLLRGVDWSRTKAYALGFGGIYINQKGRERDGTVLPGRDTEDLKTEIITHLKSWADAEKDSRPIRQVYRRQEIFQGPYADEAPDLFVGFNLGYEASFQTALGETPNVELEDNLKKWSGSHLNDPGLVPGILLSNRKITKEGPSIYDLTPSILGLIGYSAKAIKSFDFDGAPLFGP